MNGKRFGLFFVTLAATLVLLMCIVLVQSRMDSIIKTDKLVDEQYIEGAPPLVAFTTVALGGFRGIIADYLWFRSIGLQDQGKYFELSQLASWITKLQPKFTGAAAYLGWNLAYNISVTCNAPEDRWRWVHKGIEVLEEALRYNPNDPELYKELGWIYQHKLGNVLDDAQRYYKYQMARMYMHAYGAHYPDWKALAEAPKTEAEFLECYPLNSNLMQIVRGWGFPDLNALQTRFEELGKLPDKMSEVPLALKEQESIYAPTAEELAALTHYLRAKWLRESYLLRPEIVYEINQKYGDLDWFLPESFAIYWATLGNQYSPQKHDATCDRMIIQSLQVSFRNGRMLLANNEPSMYYLLIPNLALVDSTKETYLEVAERYPDTPSFRHALEYFYTDAVVLLYGYGLESKARTYYKTLQKAFPGNKSNKLSFEPFVLAEWTEDIGDGGHKQANDTISALILRSCILLGYGDKEAAAAHLRLAQYAYKRYNDRFGEERVALPPFEVMKAEITKMCLERFSFIAERLKAEILAENPHAFDEEKVKIPDSAKPNEEKPPKRP